MKIAAGFVVLAAVAALASVGTGRLHAFWDRAGPFRTVGVYAYGSTTEVTLAPDGGEMLVLATPDGRWWSSELWPQPGRLDHGAVEP